MSRMAIIVLYRGTSSKPAMREPPHSASPASIHDASGRFDSSPPQRIIIQGNPQ
jgi:hypothetical protein